MAYFFDHPVYSCNFRDIISDSAREASQVLTRVVERILNYANETHEAVDNVGMVMTRYDVRR